MRYFLELSYNGKSYHGWQNQPNAISVQEVLEKALSTLLRSTIEIVGAGRTDAGVHALHMVAHFDHSSKLDLAQLKYNLNSFLPKDIAIHDIYEVKKDAHARFDATGRTYLYRISTEKDAFNFENAYYMNSDLDMEKMNEASDILLEYNDFECFSKTNTDVKTFNCNITKANWFRNGNELHFTIKADRFLRNMVRAIVGTLINIGAGKLEVEDMHTIIKSKNRGEAGYSVPAHGLYLSKIEYPEEIR